MRPREMPPAPSWVAFHILVEGRSTCGRRGADEAGDCIRKNTLLQAENVTPARTMIMGRKTRASSGHRFVTGSVFDRSDFAVSRTGVDLFFAEICAGQSSRFFVHHQSAE